MVSLIVTVEVADGSVLDEARAAGLLAPAVLGELVEAALRRRQLRNLFAAADRLAAAAPVQSEAQSAAEVEVEIAAARAERRRCHPPAAVCGTHDGACT